MSTVQNTENREPLFTFDMPLSSISLLSGVTTCDRDLVPLITIV